jgi:hypothetical protein
MLKIWGRLSSINVRKVVLAAQWLEVPFERIDAGHEFGIVGTPGYLTKNPNGLVPRERPARPHLERWFRGILAHPASRGVLQLSPL